MVGDALEVQDLVGPGAQNVKDGRVDPVERPRRDAGQQMVDPRPPAQHADRDLGGEGAVARILQPAGRARQRRREIGPLRMHGAEHAVRGGARRGGHGSPKIAPAATRRPARNARTGNGRPPSG